MRFLVVGKEVLTSAFRGWRVWLVQLVANVALFGLFAAWLLIPVAQSWQLVLNVFVPLVVLTGVLVLHSGTMMFFHEDPDAAAPTLRSVFLAATRNVLPLVISGVIAYLGWTLIDKVGGYHETLPAYARSTLPLFVRRHISLVFLNSGFQVMMFLLRWILLPGLTLPIFLRSARFGFRVFSGTSLAAWFKSLWSLSYWVLLGLAAVIGVLAPTWLMGARPDFRTSTYGWEMSSLILRFSVAYLLGVAAWVVICALVGQQSGKSDLTASDTTAQAGA